MAYVNGGVNDSAFAHEQALFGQADIDLLKDPLGQGMPLQQMAEAKQRSRVRNTFDGQVDTDKVTDASVSEHI